MQDEEPKLSTTLELGENKENERVFLGRWSPLIVLKNCFSNRVTHFPFGMPKEGWEGKGGKAVRGYAPTVCENVKPK